MAAEFRHTKEFREARFEDADLFGAKFRDCDLRGVKIVDSFLMDVNISGLIRNFRVNDVDVTAYVEGELDRWHPERVQARSLRTVHELRAMWDVIERLWAGTTERVERLPEALRDERVDDEWSFVETQRHLIFCTDAWASRTVLDEEMPYHRLGYAHSSYPPEDAAALGIDLAAKPPYEEVMAVRADRMAVIRRIVDGLTDTELARICTRSPAPGYPEEERTVGACLGVVMREEVEHHRYICEPGAHEGGDQHQDHHDGHARAGYHQGRPVTVARQIGPEARCLGHRPRRHAA